MARQSNNNRKGFSPESLLAGLDTDLDSEINSAEGYVPTESKIGEDKEKSDIVETEIQDQDVALIEFNEGIDNKDSKKENAAEKQSVSEETLDEETIRPSLDDLVNKIEKKKSQENIYLHEDVKEDLEAFGKLIGKNNGGKSFVVETALLEYFERNHEYLEIARGKSSRKKRK